MTPRDVQDRIRRWWNEDAATYDDTPSHAATDPVEAAAWRAALLRFLPPPPARVLDVGAGTGSMTVLAAGLGHRLTALDLSEEMLDRARRKAEARGLEVEFRVGSGAEPPPGPFDAVMERHVLWTTMDPAAALGAWLGVTAPAGRLVLFEGIWHPGDAVSRARHSLAQGVRRLRGDVHDHHAEYDEEMLAGLPLARLTSAAPLLEAVEASGWRNPRIERLRDVEWVRRSAAGVAGLISGVTPQFAVVADAPG
ncbi:MAG: class I SAM-dependent methyltransferase [Actinomycetota bacterium]